MRITILIEDDTGHDVSMEAHSEIASLDEAPARAQAMIEGLVVEYAAYVGRSANWH